MKQITSMMAGVIVEILVKPGDMVNDETEVALLESMKMQLPIQSNCQGKVEEVVVKPGDFVNQGDPLILIA